MKKGVILTLLLFLLGSSYSHAQEIDLDSKSYISMSNKDKKDFQKKEKKREKIEKADAKLRKKQIKIQTKEVRKRMKKSQRQSARINQNKKESFLTRLFRKKR